MLGPIPAGINETGRTSAACHVQDFLIAIAEPVCRPEYVHEYQVSERVSQAAHHTSHHCLVSLGKCLGLLGQDACEATGEVRAQYPPPTHPCTRSSLLILCTPLSVSAWTPRRLLVCSAACPRYDSCDRCCSHPILL
jgi:hypothetical protein